MKEINPIPLAETERVKLLPDTCAMEGHVEVVLTKAVWVFAMAAGGIGAAIFFPQLDAFLVFLILTAVTICAGHSVGMHRLLIHRSFECPRPLEYFLVWLGVLVGMAGPFGMIRTHDMRDWHQRQLKCPPHPSHEAGFWRDAWWQMCCHYKLNNPPAFVIEDKVRTDPIYIFIEKTWMAQQLPLAVLLYGFGGWAWVLWGICMRIFVSLSGHWMVGHFAHRKGKQDWRIADLPVQGYNLPGFGVLTFGENWHGNHHAFPHSARLGIKPGQSDLGYHLILMFERLGWAWNIKLPTSEPARHGLIDCNAETTNHLAKNTLNSSRNCS